MPGGGIDFGGKLSADQIAVHNDFGLAISRNGAACRQRELSANHLAKGVYLTGIAVSGIATAIWMNIYGLAPIVGFTALVICKSEDIQTITAQPMSAVKAFRTNATRISLAAFVPLAQVFSRMNANPKHLYDEPRP